MPNYGLSNVRFVVVFLLLLLVFFPCSYNVLALHSLWGPDLSSIFLCMWIADYVGKKKKAALRDGENETSEEADLQRPLIFCARLSYPPISLSS